MTTISTFPPYNALNITVNTDANKILSTHSIQEGAQRDLSSLFSCTLGALIYPFIFTLATPTYRRSPVHLLFTYLLPLIPLMMFVDALVSTIRTRTPKELEKLVEQTGLDLAEWEFRSGQTLCIRPLLWTHWFIGVRKGPALDWK